MKGGSSGEGDTGTSELNDKTWHWISQRGQNQSPYLPPQYQCSGRVEKIHLKVRGTTKDHPVHIYIQTHFMTFHKVVGKLSGSGEQELVFNAPPGNDWLWKEGENDGEVHGPLRTSGNTN